MSNTIPLPNVIQTTIPCPVRIDPPGIDGRQICDQTAPMPESHEGLWAHPDAKLIDEDLGGVSKGSYEKYECPHCNTQFWVELPD